MSAAITPTRDERAVDLCVDIEASGPASARLDVRVAPLGG